MMAGRFLPSLFFHNPEHAIPTSVLFNCVDRMRGMEQNLCAWPSMRDQSNWLGFRIKIENRDVETETKMPRERFHGAEINVNKTVCQANSRSQASLNDDGGPGLRRQEKTLSPAIEERVVVMRTF
jgi:hypothetical protein